MSDLIVYRGFSISRTGEVGSDGSLGILRLDNKGSILANRSTLDECMNLIDSWIAHAAYMTACPHTPAPQDAYL